LLVLQGFHMNDQKGNQPKCINPEVPWLAPASLETVPGSLAAKG
jgi:hypothetical protein